ncbi:MAG: hypothetical protein Wins2KO_19410 [Winogradskyella sp.]
MKKIIIILITLLTFSACKNDAKANEVNLEENRAKSYDANDGYITMRGEFIYYGDAAVFKVGNEMYGVVIDDNMHTLNEQVKPFKKEDTDMVPVTVRVKRFKKPEGEEGWPNRVIIKDILKVEEPTTDTKDVIKLAN